MSGATAGLQRSRRPAPPGASWLTPAHGGLFQRKCACGASPGGSGKCEFCSNQELLPVRGTGAPPVPEVPPIVQDVLRSPGQPLDPATRAFMEPRFGFDFSRVRVHSDSAAAESARALSARAYTLGSDIVFGRGAYAPASVSGRWLLAHELTHVCQQGGGRSGTVLRRSPEAPAYDLTTVPHLPDARADGSVAEDQKEDVAQELAEALTAIAKRSSPGGEEGSEDQGLEQQARTTADEVSDGRSARDISPAGSGAVQALPDTTTNQASKDTIDYLTALEDVQRFPLLSVILSSPTLRPFDVQEAARTGKLTNFSAHPGSTFLGAVGEALVYRALKFQSKAGVRGALSTFVFPQPGTLVSLGIKLPSEATPLLKLIGSLLPDLLVILIGGEFVLDFGVVKIHFRQDVELLNIIDPTTGSVGSRTFTGQTVLAFLEVTTSTQFKFIEPRALKVAAMAKALALAKLPAGLEVVAMLAIDRGAFFSLSATEQKAITDPVYAAGGLVAVFRDLTKLSIEDARKAASDLASLNP